MANGLAGRMVDFDYLPRRVDRDVDRASPALVRAGLDAVPGDLVAWSGIEDHCERVADCVDLAAVERVAHVRCRCRW